MELHLRVVHTLDQVEEEENLRELSSLEARFDVKRLCRVRWGVSRLSHLVCDLVSGAENDHNHNNHLHIFCDSLLGHSIFVCTLFLGPGKDQIYLDFDSDIANVDFGVSYRKCK